MHLFTADERATPLKIAGVLLGLAGVAIMIGLDVLSGVGAGAVGQIACLTARWSMPFPASTAAASRRWA